MTKIEGLLRDGEEVRFLAHWRSPQGSPGSRLLESLSILTWLPFLVLVQLLVLIPVLAIPFLFGVLLLGAIWLWWLPKGGIWSRLLIVTSRRVLLKDHEQLVDAPCQAVRFHRHPKDGWIVEGMDCGDIHVALVNPELDLRLELMSLDGSSKISMEET